MLPWRAPIPNPNLTLKLTLTLAPGPELALSLGLPLTLLQVGALLPRFCLTAAYFAPLIVFWVLNEHANEEPTPGEIEI